jgi:hypothetical protein
MKDMVGIDCKPHLAMSTSFRRIRTNASSDYPILNVTVNKNLEKSKFPVIRMYSDS